MAKPAFVSNGINLFVPVCTKYFAAVSKFTRNRFLDVIFIEAIAVK